MVGATLYRLGFEMGKAKTKSEKMQDFVRYFKDKHGVISADMREVAAEAERMGWKMPKPKTQLDMVHVHGVPKLPPRQLGRAMYHVR